MLLLRFTRISPTHHKFEYVREDGTGEVKELETKTFLVHDLIHFCIESEAKLKDGFYGLLERGLSYADLSGEATSKTETKIAMEVERVTGPFAALVRGATTTKAVIDSLENFYDAYKEKMPEWITADMLEGASESFHHLMGKWNSLPFGQTLELQFKI